MDIPDSIRASEPLDDERMQAFWAKCMEIEDDQLAFVIDRDAEVVARDGLQKGPSAEAMETLHFQMLAFVATRITRHQQATGVMPQRVTVVMNVGLD